MLFLCIIGIGLLGACDYAGPTKQTEAGAETNIAETNIDEINSAETNTAETDVLSASVENVSENAVASFVTEDGVGSCIVLYQEDEKILVATASHVARKTENVLINGTEAVVTNYWRSPTFDLVYIWVETENTLSLESAAPSVKAFNELQEESVISVLGMVANEKVYQQGTVKNCWIYMEDFGYHMLWGEVKGVKGGMSGGGVFDSKGRLIGMLCGGDGDSEIAVLPVSIMKAEWKNSDLELAIDIFAE